MGWVRRAAVAAAAIMAGWLGAAGVAGAAPALWVVRDADSEIYLFGTLHALEPGAAWRTPAFDRAYAKATTLWFEADLDAADPAMVRSLLAQYGVDPERTLSQKLGGAELAALRPLLAASRVDPARFDHLRPWAAALMLSMQPVLAKGGQVEAGVDMTVTRQAKAGAKQVRTFETLEDQARLFASLPEPAELRYLAEVIRERAAPPHRIVVRHEPGSLAQAWIAGDLARLGPALVGGMKADNPALYEALLRRRNLAWADALTKEMAGSGVELVNVGALHMVGEDSLPALMKARGFDVERIQ